MSLWDIFLPDPFPKKKKPGDIIGVPSDPLSDMVKTTYKVVKEVVSDPETEGKKEGYKRAAQVYEPIYQSMKTHYHDVIQSLKKEMRHSDTISLNLIHKLKSLEMKRDQLKQELAMQQQRTARKMHISTGNLKTLSGPSFSWSNNTSYGLFSDFDLLDWIHNKRRAPYEKQGYAEAEALYKEKMQQLNEIFEQERANLQNKRKEYSSLILDILNEIAGIKKEIADLQLCEKLGEDE